MFFACRAAVPDLERFIGPGYFDLVKNCKNDADPDPTLRSQFAAELEQASLIYSPINTH